MPKYLVEVRWLTKHVERATVEVEADDARSAEDIAYEMVLDDALTFDGSDEIVDGEYFTETIEELK